MALPAKPALTPVPVPLPQRGQVETVFTPAMNNFIAWTPIHQQNLIDTINWIQSAYGESETVYNDTVAARDAAAQSAADAQGFVDTAAQQVEDAVESTLAQAQDFANSASESADSAKSDADRAFMTVQDGAEAAAVIATQQATDQANRARNEADRAEIAADDSQSASTDALNAVASLSPRLGLNIGSWKLEEGELIVSHLSTATPSIVDGDFILMHEELEEFA